VGGYAVLDCLVKIARSLGDKDFVRQEFRATGIFVN